MEAELGVGNLYDYGFRIYNQGIGKFLSVDPLTKEYPWYTPYQFAGNKPLRFIDLDGLEEANPSIFRKSFNVLTGDFVKNRMNAYITKNKIDPETVIALPNDTSVVRKTSGDETLFSIFRRAKVGSWALGTSGSHDDIDLTKEELSDVKILGAVVLDAPDPFGSTTKNGLKLMAFSRRNIVLVVKQAKKSLQVWKKEIKIGLPDVNGMSGDAIKKGTHLHFKNLKGIEGSVVLGGGIGI